MPTIQDGIKEVRLSLWKVIADTVSRTSEPSPQDLRMIVQDIDEMSSGLKLMKDSLCA